jgi:thiol:disulfide interchange protein DsbD
MAGHLGAPPLRLRLALPLLLHWLLFDWLLVDGLLLHGRRLLLVLALTLASVPAAHADLPRSQDDLARLVRADLLAQDEAIAPGTDAVLGLRLRHAPHWHTYWTDPGDAGLPTRLRWTLPPGYSAGPIQWPAPQLLRVGDLANYGYEDEVVLPVSIHVPASARIDSRVKLAVRADWLVCSDLCIPGGADLSLELPVRAVADVRPGPDAPAFVEARRRIPQPIALRTAHASLRDDHVHLEFSGTDPVARSLTFFPLDAGRIVPAAPQLVGHSGERVTLDMQTVTPVEDGFTALQGVLVADGGPPPGGQGWQALIDVPIERAAAKSGVPAAGAAAPGGGPGPGLARPHAPAAALIGPGPQPQFPAAPAAPGASAAPAPGGTANAELSVLAAVAGAFLGGLILNLMPCVFPVLSLKLVDLVRHGRESPERMRRHGLAFAAGVILSFLALAALLLSLRAAGSGLGWGFQLQSPLVVAALLALFFLLGLNLLGTFEFTLGSGLANSRAAQLLDGSGLRGSFATGVLAAVVASPCTAPFMGAALGFAITQPALPATAVFVALGAGMATPYLVVSFVPRLLAWLPRPGAWMERLKHVMAFPMFITCVWLFWVLGQQTDIDMLALVLAALVAVGLSAWALGVAQREQRGFAWLAALAAVATLALLAPLARSGIEPVPAPAAPAASAAGTADWTGWSAAIQQDALDHGRPVFVDFTAAWCITCQANKRLVLHDTSVEQAFRKRGVVLLRADWTRRDETIARELARFARSGVPMYVLYDRHGAPHLMPEILSTQGLLAALAAL